MRAFVTGGTGFVGAHLVAALRARGAAVTVLVRSPARAARLGWGPDVRIVRGDLTDAAALAAACAGADVVFHVAGIVSARSPAEFFRANRDGTARVLEAAAAHPPRRFVLVPSVAAAGPNPPGQPHESGEEASPVSEYGRSKPAAEDLVRGGDLPWSAAEHWAEGPALAAAARKLATSFAIDDALAWRWWRSWWRGDDRLPLLNENLQHRV